MAGVKRRGLRSKQKQAVGTATRNGQPVWVNAWQGVKTAQQVVDEDTEMERRNAYAPGDRFMHSEWVASVGRAPFEQWNFWWRLYELYGRKNEGVRRASEEWFDMGGEA